MSIIGSPVSLGHIGHYASIEVTAATGSTVTCTTPSGIILTTTEVSGKWLFDGLDRYGNYTITASKDSKTKTRTVSVDSSTKYEITIAYVLYLYNQGDECTSASGGWTGGATIGSSATKSGTLTKNSDNLNLSASSNCIWSLATNSMIDLSGYDTFNITLSCTVMIGNINSGYHATKFQEVGNLKQFSGSTFSTQTYTVNISTVTSTGYINISTWQSTTYIYKIWLE